MKLFLDLKNRRFVKSAASNVALDRLVLKRRDTLPIEILYVENGALATPPAGTTAAVGLKAKFSDDNFLAYAAPGQTTLDLNTIPVEAAFSSNPSTVSALLEIRWGAPGTALRTATLQVEVQNSVITGDEATPAAIPDGKATEDEATEGTDNTKWMTPLRTAQAIQALAATDWDSITGKPAEFPPEPHTAADITDFAEAVAEVSPPTTWENIPGKPSVFPPENHTHPTSEVTGLDQNLADLESADVALGERIDYLTENLDPAAIDSIAEAAASIGTLQTQLDQHQHTAADITDFASAVEAVSPPVDWSSLTGKPDEFPPESHTHPAEQITGLSDFIIASAPGLSITTTVHTATGATDTYSVGGLASSDPAHVLVQLNGVTQTPVTDYLIDFPNGLIIFDGIPASGTQIALTALGLRTVQPPVDPALYRYASDTSSDGLTNYYGRIANTDYTGTASATDPVWTIHRTTFDLAGRVVSTGSATSVAWANRTTATYQPTP